MASKAAEDIFDEDDNSPADAAAALEAAFADDDATPPEAMAVEEAISMDRPRGRRIEHEEEESLFYVLLDAEKLESSQRAYLKYRRSDAGSEVAQVDIWSTYVPESHRGKGLAERLVEHSFAWAEEQGLHITSSCWYATKLLEKRKLV